MNDVLVPAQSETGAVAEPPEVIPLETAQVLCGGRFEIGPTRRPLAIKQAEHSVHVCPFPGLLGQIHVPHIPVTAGFVPLLLGLFSFPSDECSADGQGCHSADQ